MQVNLNGMQINLSMDSPRSCKVGKELRTCCWEGSSKLRDCRGLRTLLAPVCLHRAAGLLRSSHRALHGSGVNSTCCKLSIWIWSLRPTLWKKNYSHLRDFVAREEKRVVAPSLCHAMLLPVLHGACPVCKGSALRAGPHAVYQGLLLIFALNIMFPLKKNLCLVTKVSPFLLPLWDDWNREVPTFWFRVVQQGLAGVSVDPWSIHNWSTGRGLGRP